VAVAAIAAVAALLPFAGTWATADREPAPAARAEAERAPRPEPEPRPSGERRRPASRTGRVMLGAYIPGAPRRAAAIARYERKTGHSPAILLYYRKVRRGPAFDEASLRQVHEAGAVPMITWEPWDQRLADIGRGRYDDYFRATARAARRWGHPIMLRFAHEMNGNWYPWGAHVSSPGEYVRAWRRLVRLFRQEEADNVKFVWAPNADTGGMRLIRRFYPGDRWVDWVGLSGFAWGGPWDWLSAREVFGRSYRTITRMTRKPFVIAETAAGEAGGDKARWIEQTFRRDLPRMRRVRAVIWFNGRQQWAHWDVDSTRAALRAFRAAAADPRYAGTAADVEQGGRDR
jgi:mannan endo-1,4-beta-mannosidase